MARQIVVDVVGDSSKFSKATDQAVTKATGLTSNLKNVGKGMVIGAGIGAFNLLTSAIDGAIGMAAAARKAFQDDQVSQELLAQSLKNNIPNWSGNTAGAEAFAGAQGRLGFADDEVRASLGMLVGTTHDLNEAQKLSALAMDVARAKGIDLATATTIVQKASEGNGKALKSMGVDIGGAKTATELLAAVTQNASGAAEKFATTSAGKEAASQVKVGEAMERVGAIVDKVATVAIPILADAFEAVIGVVERVIEIATPIVALFTRIFSGIGGVVRGAMNGVIDLINNVIDAINGIQVHIHTGPVNIDFDGLNIGHLPRLHLGGVVPGVAGSEVPVVLQAGEVVTPRGGGGPGAGVTVVIQGNVYGGPAGLDELADALMRRMRLTAV
jgi:hypothetical protein